MEKNSIKFPLPKLDDIFSIQEERDVDKLEKIIDIPISQIDEFPNHPFKVLDNDDMKDLKKSISDNGVLSPALVRPKADGRYELISGHRRKFASELALKETLPCIVRNLSDDEATIIMVDSNMQREEILPSEKAFAYKMKLDAISHQGKDTSRQDGEKLLSVDILGKEQGDSGRTVQRYIRLTYLIPELLEMVDSKEIALSPAVELSYLTKEEQLCLMDCMDYNICTPSHHQAIELKDLSKSGNLSKEAMDEIMSKEKPNQVQKVKFDEDRIRSVLPRNVRDEEMENFVVKAIQHYSNYLKKKELGAR